MTDVIPAPAFLPTPGQIHRYGADPVRDAWLLHFMTENNIEPSVNPAENAQPEQLRFMVDLDDDQVELAFRLAIRATVTLPNTL